MLKTTMPPVTNNKDVILCLAHDFIPHKGAAALYDRLFDSGEKYD